MSINKSMLVKTDSEGAVISSLKINCDAGARHTDYELAVCFRIRDCDLQKGRD